MRLMIYCCASGTRYLPDRQVTEQRFRVVQIQRRRQNLPTSTNTIIPIPLSLLPSSPVMALTQLYLILIGRSLLFHLEQLELIHLILSPAFDKRKVYRLRRSTLPKFDLPLIVISSDSLERRLRHHHGLLAVKTIRNGRRWKRTNNRKIRSRRRRN